MINGASQCSKVASQYSRPKPTPVWIASSITGGGGGGGGRKEGLDKLLHKNTMGCI